MIFAVVLRLWILVNHIVTLNTDALPIWNPKQSDTANEQEVEEEVALEALLDSTGESGRRLSANKQSLSLPNVEAVAQSQVYQESIGM